MAVYPNRVLDERIRRHMTQRELAYMAGVDPGTIIRAEHGERLRPLAQQKIADALGLGRRELFPEDLWDTA